MNNPLLWFTDTHLNYVPWSKRILIKQIEKFKPSGVIISGDISSGTSLINDLAYLAKILLCPLYFVCGNHDAWFSSFAEIQNALLEMMVRYENLHYLSGLSGEVKLSNDTCLIGDDGWYDCGAGTPYATIFTGDWVAIKDLRTWPFEKCIDKFRTLAKTSVDKLESKLVLAAEKFKTIYLVTHIPPWSTEEDKNSMFKEYFLPYNANIGLGKMLESVMSKYSRADLIVLSGHTHCHEILKISHNIECRVGLHGVRNRNSPIIF